MTIYQGERFCNTTSSSLAGFLQVASLAVAVVGVAGLPEAGKVAAVEGIALGVQLGGYDDVRFKSEVSAKVILRQRKHWASQTGQTLEGSHSMQ